LFFKRIVVAVVAVVDVSADVVVTEKKD